MNCPHNGEAYGFVEFFEFLKQNNAELICTRMSLDTSTPTGEAMVVILMALAKLELDIKSERNRKSTQYRASEGLYNGGRPILGYDLNEDPTQKGMLTVNETEALIVQEAFKKYLELGSDSAVAKHLSGKGYINKLWIKNSTVEEKGGGPITSNVAKTMLTNIKYIALREYTEYDPVTPEDIPKTRNASWKAIISEELFYEVQDARALSYKNKRNVALNHKGKRHFYLLLDVTHCGYCDERMESRSGKRRKYYAYVCKNDICPHSEELPSGKRSRNHVDADDADSATYSVMSEIVDSDEYLTRFTGDLNKSILEELPKLRGELKALTNRAREIKAEVHELSRALPSFTEGSEEYTVNKNQVQQQAKVLSNIEKRKKELRVLLDDKSAQRVSKDDIRSLLINMRKLAEYGPQKQRRELVRNLFRRVDISEEKLVFQLHLNSLRYIHQLSTRAGGFEQIANWRLDEDSNLGPSG